MGADTIAAIGKKKWMRLAQETENENEKEEADTPALCVFGHYDDDDWPTSLMRPHTLRSTGWVI